MNLIIIPTPEFSRSAKKLYKKYRQTPKDLKYLKKELEQNPKSGISLGKNCFKIRIPNSSVPVGKRSGFRVVYYYWSPNKIYLLDIYSKTDLDNITHTRLVEILEKNKLY